jgi:hypothetical protein
VRTLSPTDGSVDSWADDPGPLTIRFVPGNGGFDDGGVTLIGTPTALTIGAIGAYTGVSVEIWAPGASTVQVDGSDVATTTDGPWLRATVTPGSVSWK